VRWVTRCVGSALTGSRATRPASTPSNRRIPEPNSRGESGDRELVDQAGVHVLQARCATARDSDFTVAGGLAGSVERRLDAVGGSCPRTNVVPQQGVGVDKANGISHTS
jgi:hypothetical protein